MKALSYSDKLKDPRWQKKRLSILDRDEWACKLCADSHKTLHVHHKSYERGKMPWEYPDENFVTLCELCHEEVEFQKQLLSQTCDFKPIFTAVSKSLLLLKSDLWYEFVQVVHEMHRDPNYLISLHRKLPDLKVAGE